MLRAVVDRVGADFVRTIEMEEERVGDRRIAVADFHADSIAAAK